jgi:hypothetical protein
MIAVSETSLKIFIVISSSFRLTPNGLRYPLVGGTRPRHFAGTNFKPRKMLKNAATPTSRVHALLGNHEPARTLAIKKAQSLTDKLAP